MKRCSFGESADLFEGPIEVGTADVLDTAESVGERNELGELLQWCHVTKGLARTTVDASLKLPKISGGVPRKVGSLGHVLTQ